MIYILGTLWQTLLWTAAAKRRSKEPSEARASVGLGHTELRMGATLRCSGGSTEAEPRPNTAQIPAPGRHGPAPVRALRLRPGPAPAPSAALRARLGG